MRADGTDQERLTDNQGPDELPQWSPDGQWIAFLSTHRKADVPRKAFFLYRMRPDGSEQMPLTDGPRWDSAPQWSPDGQWITFASTENVMFDVYRVRADGTRVEQRLTTRREGDESLPLWSPDGQWIVYISNHGGSYEIFKMRADGTEQRQLQTGSNQLPQWSPPMRRQWHPWRAALLSGGFFGAAVLPWNVGRRRNKFAYWRH